MLKAIGERRLSKNKLDNAIREIERSFSAALHGVKYEPKLESVEESAEPRLTSEQQATVEAHLKRRMEQMQRGKKNV